ncbi:MAG: hypothetical protein JWL98_1824 [Xanthomonadaceae bacterium]|nr:hypothetical protein [Xanthomonadaceae bacterium]
MEREPEAVGPAVVLPHFRTLANHPLESSFKNPTKFININAV